MNPPGHFAFATLLIVDTTPPWSVVRRLSGSGSAGSADSTSGVRGKSLRLAGGIAGEHGDIYTGNGSALNLAVLRQMCPTTNVSYDKFTKLPLPPWRAKERTGSTGR
eukprot:5041077-Prymnesium_polylepis.1